ncbi:SCO1 protein [Defluviimonas aquaemixtae]|uniref:SCO1 protein n=1 Tax=Albidovulum aquaemixtae TaxID=1542388 RepID=A0A2R8BJH2_9RHOB|nr:SCO family protein [Defluviimonas aquaemixtae]SPH23513.1 SCO1 protein [Defluviimonas aquaemixtae]
MAVSVRSYSIAATSVVAIALIAIYSISRNGVVDQFSDCRTTRMAAGGTVIGGTFTLTDENGQSVTDKDIITKPTLLYFGYTFCPDVCPMDTARNAEAVDALEEQGYDVTPVIISVDPTRDTPEVLKEWTDYIHPRMIGLTGTPDQIADVAKTYRTYYKVPESPEDEYYLVDHATHTYLMLPDHGFVEFFSRDTTPEVIAERAACFIDAAAS